MYQPSHGPIIQVYSSAVTCPVNAMPSTSSSFHHYEVVEPQTYECEYAQKAMHQQMQSCNIASIEKRSLSVGSQSISMKNLRI